jgi:hypothetical protein
MDEHELRRLFPKPELSPFFAARVSANLPPPARPAPRWMRLYWMALALAALAAMAAPQTPVWLLYPIVPVVYALTLVPKHTLLRYLGPFLR